MRSRAGGGGRGWATLTLGICGVEVKEGFAVCVLQSGAQACTDLLNIFCWFSYEGSVYVVFTALTS
jgi:hypothetical protein